MSHLQSLKDLKVSYRKCFESEDGKKVLKDLEMRCYITSTTFNADPYVSAFQEGTRSVVLHIKQAMDIEKTLPEEREESNG
jgi:hypothetical protein